MCKRLARASTEIRFIPTNHQGPKAKDDSFSGHSAVGNSLRGNKKETSSREETQSFKWLSPFVDESIDIMLLLNTAIKFADLNHSTKPFTLHERWTNRVTDEFWGLGDRERKLGVPISPLCDRENDKNVAKSQIGFFQFICVPFYELVGDLCDPSMPYLLQLHVNLAAWKEQFEAEKQVEAMGNVEDEASRGGSPRASEG